MRALWDSVAGPAIGGVVIALMLGWFALDLYGCVADSTQNRLDECEQALDDVDGDGQLPAILTEDWCLDHLTGRTEDTP